MRGNGRTNANSMPVKEREGNVDSYARISVVHVEVQRLKKRDTGRKRCWD